MAGPIGLGAIAPSRISGASQIIAFDVIDERVKIAKEMVQTMFNTNTLGNGYKPSDKVMELTRGRGADIQVEAAGAAPMTIPQIRKKPWPLMEKIIYLGRAAASTLVHLDHLHPGANKIIGARGHSGYGIFPSIIKLIVAGKLNLEKMITARYSFESVMDAIKAPS